MPLLQNVTVPKPFLSHSLQHIFGRTNEQHMKRVSVRQVYSRQVTTQRWKTTRRCTPLGRWRASDKHNTDIQQTGKQLEEPQIHFSWTSVSRLSDLYSFHLSHQVPPTCCCRCLRQPSVPHLLHLLLLFVLLFLLLHTRLRLTG